MNHNEEEIEKYNLFQREILRESDFLKKIKDIFKLQNTEKFQDILILQKNRYIEQIEKEVLYILKKIYTDKIINNRTFNSLFKSGIEDFKLYFNRNYEEINSEWEYFKELKNNYNLNNKEIINSYYITDFRKHCHNHEGFAIHKCGLAEKGKFIKISGKLNARFKNNKEIKYIVCEECQKVFLKDLFTNYCSNCKEIYLCSILSPTENKDYILATYSNPHCETFINKTIPCKLCKEKLYVFISEKKIKCLKCNYVIDLNNRNDLQWQCTKCNKYFYSNIKIYNPTESYILTKILKKALLLKVKARPKFMNCCNIDINNTSFYHKKECKGILYLCNVENYFLNKKWVIVCEKCHAINNCKNFIWTCPKCLKRTRETNEIDDILKSPPRKVSSSHYNINKVEDTEELNNKEKEQKVNIFQKYLSNYINKKASITSCSNENNYIRKRIEFNNGMNNNINNRYIYSKKDQNDKKDEKQFNSEKDNMIKVNIKVNDNLNNLNNNSRYKYYIRSPNRCSIRRNNENLVNTNNNTSIKSINTIKKFNNSGEKYYAKSNLIMEENQNNNNNINKMESSMPINRINYIKKNYSMMYSTLKEEEKNREQKNKVQRGESYKSSSIIDEKEEKNETFNIEYFDDNKSSLNSNNKFLVFNLENKRNIPIKLRYNNNDRNNNNIIYTSKKQNFKKSMEIEESNNNKISEYEKNEEDLIDRNKRFIFNSVDEKLFNNNDGIISKETTAHGSKGSIASSSKENNSNSNNNNFIYNFNYNNFNSSSSVIMNVKKLDNSNLSNNNSKDKDYFYSTSNNFKNKRKYYYNKAKDKANENITNLKNNITNENLINRFQNCKTILEINDTESNNNIDIYCNKKDIDKPDDIIEPSDIDYSEDIPIYDYKFKQNKELYDSLQNGIKKILEKGRLPQFNIDNYTIGKKIGDGAFAVLFSVVNNKTKKKYALKKLTAHDLKLLEEFHREFEIVYHSDHENILNFYGICIRIYDSTTISLFVLMDLAERDWEVEINKRFKEKNYYKEEELISILKQLSSALVYLQNKEVAHRDIKPENILLFFNNNDVTYKICDFGEAKEKIKVNSRHKSIRGTDFYMSPILFKGLTQEEKFVRDNPYKSDVFSLGYCMIIACVLDFNFINKIRNVEEQTKVDKIIRESLEERYSFKFIYVLLKMIVYHEKERIDFLGLEKLIKEEL